MRIVCFGPGPKFKGGISNYNTSLARAFDRLGVEEVHIVSWTQQYPAIIPREFVDKTSSLDFLEDTRIHVHYITNYNNPYSWRETYHLIMGLEPDIVIFQWAIAIQGLPLGRIARLLKKHKNIEVIFDLHFVIQKENSSLDKWMTRFGIRHADTYITHAYRTVDELKEVFPARKLEVNETGERAPEGKTTVIKLYHPIYDLFRPDPAFDVAGEKEKLGLRENVFLFFGFIRKYKGLHFAIEAFADLAKKRDDVSLLVCGESFWNTLEKKKFSTRVKKAVFGAAKKIFLSKRSDEGEYRPLELISKFGIEDRVVVKNEFIPNEDVHKYFQVSDAVVLFYEFATPSGVESLSYNFELPILATAVGHFPETIEDGYNGYLAEPEDIGSMTAVMEKMIDHPIDRKHVVESTKMMSWDNYARAILNRGGGGA